MTTVRIALAQLCFSQEPQHCVSKVTKAVAEASSAGALVVCFPECFVPGFRGLGFKVPPADASFLHEAWETVAKSAALHKIHVILGTERFVDDKLTATALVINSNGVVEGFQDKVQIDPSEEGVYAPGRGRRIFNAGPLTFGVVICHEGFRYPETVRWAAQQGAQIVFHPHLHIADAEFKAPSKFADPQNSFHEKSMLCRAAENTCYFASVNYCVENSGTTSVVVHPDGSVLCYQKYGSEGLLLADVDLQKATRLLAKRFKPQDLRGVDV